MFSEKQLKEMAQTETTALVEGGTLDNAKPIYWHTIKFQRGGTGETSSYSRLLGYMIVLNNSEDALTLSDFQGLINTPGFKAVLINGKASSAGDSNLENLSLATTINDVAENSFSVMTRNETTNVETELLGYTTTSGWALFQDLGANKIN